MDLPSGRLEGGKGAGSVAQECTAGPRVRRHQVSNAGNRAPQPGRLSPHGESQGVDTVVLCTQQAQQVGGGGSERVGWQVPGLGFDPGGVTPKLAALLPVHRAGGAEPVSEHSIPEGRRRDFPRAGVS